MARASRRKFHYIYKITNKLNGKFYIGMHSTDNLDDGYFGSGQLLWKSIRKHGKESHEMEILEHYFSREDLATREKELVNFDLLENDLCLNLAIGGDGGWSHLIKDEHYYETRRRTARKTMEKFKSSVSHRKKLKNRAKRLNEEGKLKPLNWTGLSHSEETKKKMSESAKGKHSGEANGNFGKCWIHHKELSRVQMVLKSELQSWQDLGWSLGRKLGS